MVDCPNKCVICNTTLASKTIRKTKVKKTRGPKSKCPIEVSDKEMETMNQNLDAFFTVRNLLGIPQTTCEEFLEEHGNPFKWGVFTCSTCQEKFVDKARTIQEQIAQLESQFNEIKGEAVAEVVKSCREQEMEDMEPEDVGPSTGRQKVARGKRKSRQPVHTEVRVLIMQRSTSVGNVNEAGENSADTISKLVADAGGTDKFVSQNKAESAFKEAGPGRTLADGSLPGPSSSAKLPPIIEVPGSLVIPGPSNSTNSKGNGGNGTTVLVSEERRVAAAAAFARLEKNKRPEANSKEFLAARQAAFIREQAQKEIKADINLKELENFRGESSNQGAGGGEFGTACQVNAHVVNRVFYTCPFIGPEVASKIEIENKIKTYLFRNLVDEQEVTSCLLIHSCNKPIERVTTCVNTLCKYLNNIIEHPTEEMYRKIKCSNKAFFDKVNGIVGSEDFLTAAGFEKVIEQVGNWREGVWMFSPDHFEDDGTVDLSFVLKFTALRDTLLNTKPIKPQLDRNVQVLKVAHIDMELELPDDFYTLSAEEIKKEQKLKTELMEKKLKLRTKAMRDQDEMREQRSYRYGIMRIRFPDGITLQGTFGALEDLRAVREFVRDNLLNRDMNFELIRPGGDILAEINSTIAELRLLPSSVINFRDLNGISQPTNGYLKSDVLKFMS